MAAAVRRHDVDFSGPDDRLSPSLAANLALLELLPPRAKIQCEQAWHDVVADALRIAQLGWASTAVSLGWSEWDLFGVGPRDDGEFAGLAVWLRGRRIVMLDAAGAIARNGDERHYFVRPALDRCLAVAPVLLWEFGR